MRPYGSGSIQELRPGTYRVRVSRNGKQVGRVVHGSRSDAQAVLRSLGNTPHSVAVAPESLGKVVEDFLAVSEARITSRTHRNYRVALRHLVARFGESASIAEISARDLDRFYTGLQEKLSASSVQTVHWAVRSMFSQAKRWGLVTIVPEATPPRVVKEESPALSPEEVRRLIDGATEVLGLFILLGALTGARRGELCGLQRSDITFSAGTVTIRRQIVTGEVCLPKGNKTRALSLADQALGLLRNREGYLLSNDGGMTPLTPVRISEQFRDLATRLGIDAHPHSLRHFHQTVLVGHGVDPTTAAARAGHSPSMMLSVYSHRVGTNDRAAARLLERVLAVEEEGVVDCPVLPPGTVLSGTDSPTN